MQIIVIEELHGDTFKWLSVLTDKLTEINAKKFVATANGLMEIEDKKLADSIMQVLLSANGKVFAKIKEDDTMSAALMELMKPEVEKYAEDYAQDYARKKDVERAKIMIQRGEDNEYIRLLTQLTDKDIDELRKAAQ